MEGQDNVTVSSSSDVLSLQRTVGMKAFLLVQAVPWLLVFREHFSSFFPLSDFLVIVPVPPLNLIGQLREILFPRLTALWFCLSLYSWSLLLWNMEGNGSGAATCSVPRML